MYTSLNEPIILLDSYCVQLSSILLIEVFIVLASIDSCCL